mmetsp:Transcript_306/g.806  ORF Transcript_306/g.806 Transcript_306/m.806 type:complete len:524 (+) Transcript_306:292-1863(+)|eukprot:CAMPEP_0168193382 /NCGR_PEP_ID=MMETSP0139_2-20121125/18577_1 /TAXON_ID=44445 /ORGANISM="Pseudo-nitzschia australis, Strain 10249 10 AB" /LENGTH=523 /DNA_ID=CAMNT_0008116735 /DNA_START=148 /DNA_END=1719 /DNA_ORIENTATION=-
MDHSSGDDDDRDRRRDHSDRSHRAGSHHHREGSYEGRQHGRNQPYQHHHNHHNYYHNSRDYDTRSQSSQKSDPNSETSAGRGEAIHSNMSTTGSVGSHGSGGGDSSRGFPLHGHVHFRNHAISAAHLLNGDPAHQFPPSLYQPSADAPKSDTATVCSGSMLEDIEDVGSHYDGESIMSGQASTNSSKQPQQQHHHHYPPPSGGIRRSNSKEGSRLVDFAERSQEALRVVFPKQSKAAGYASIPPESSSFSHAAAAAVSGSNDEDAMQHKKGMGPPLSRHWLLQQHGSSPFRTGSVKSIGSNTGSDVVVNVGSDCGGSLTDAQSLLSQEDAALLATVNSEISSDPPPAVSAASAAKNDTLDESGSTGGATGAVEDEKKPHPLLCDQSDGKTNGRTSPGGTIYRGRGIRRYKGRFYALPLKRFHQDGVHLHSDSEPESSTPSFDCQQKQQDRWDDRCGGNSRFEDRRGGESHNYYGHASHDRDRNHDRDRSRSRSRSPPTEDRGRESRNRKMDPARGYKIEKKQR